MNQDSLSLENEPTSSSEKGDGRSGLFGAVLAMLEKIGKAVMPAILSGKLGIGRSLRALPTRLHRSANQLSLLIELFDDYSAGEYRDVPWRSVAVVTGALVYVISPIDLIPIAIPFVGAVDDALVVALTMRYLRKDLENYCQFKGYDPDKYFGRAAA